MMKHKIKYMTVAIALLGISQLAYANSNQINLPNQDSTRQHDLQSWRNATSGRSTGIDNMAQSCSDRYSSLTPNNASQFPFGQINYQRDVFYRTLVNSETVIDSYGEWNETGRTCYQNFYFQDSPACPANQRGEIHRERRYTIVELIGTISNDTGWVETSNTCDYYSLRNGSENEVRPCPSGQEGSGVFYTRNYEDFSDGSRRYTTGWVETGRDCTIPAYPTSGFALDTHVYDSYGRPGGSIGTGFGKLGSGWNRGGENDSWDFRCSKPYSKRVDIAGGGDSTPDTTYMYCQDDQYSEEMWFLREYNANNYEGNGGWTNQNGGFSTVILTQIYDNSRFFDGSGNSGFNTSRPNNVTLNKIPTAQNSTIPVPYFYDANGYLRINLSGVRLHNCHINNTNCISYAGSRVGTSSNAGMTYTFPGRIGTDISALPPIGCLYGDFYSNWNTNNTSGNKQRLTNEQIKNQSVWFNINYRWNENDGISDWRWQLPCYRQP